MTSKRVVPRSQADRDLKDAIDYYIDAGANDAALGLVDAVEVAYAGISSHPGSGSPRYGQALNMPGLRAWPLSRYPYLVFFQFALIPAALTSLAAFSVSVRTN